MAESCPEHDTASGAAADAGTPTLGTPEGEGLAETDVANWMREQLATEVGRLAKLGAKVVTMQVKNCCVVREELTEAEVAAEAAAASSGAGAEPAAPKPAGKGKRRGGRRHKAAAAKAAKAKAVDVAVAAEKTTSSERAADAAEPAAKAADEEADAGEAGGETTEAQTDAGEEAAGEEGEEEEAAAPSGPTRLVNRLEVDTTYDFDLVNQLLVSPPVDCPLKEGYKLVTLVLLETRAPVPRLLSYLYQADMPGHSLDRWIFINRELKESYHVVSFA